MRPEIAYLASLVKLEADVKACNDQDIIREAATAGLAQAKQDLADAAPADKPALQAIVDLWQAQLDFAREKLADLVHTYRDDRIASTLLLQQLLTLSPNEDVPGLNGETLVLDPAINSSVPQRINPTAN